MENPRETSDGVEIDLHVQPGARASSIVGTHGGRWKIAIREAPEDGKANTAIVAFIADKLGLPKRDVSLLRGHKSRQKTILVGGSTLDPIRAEKTKLFLIRPEALLPIPNDL